MRTFRDYLAELIGFEKQAAGDVKELRQTAFMGVTIHALVMTIDEGLSIPAYLLEPPEGVGRKSAVMSVHGHGSVEPTIGLRDDYHHKYALELARDGHLVLAPELRGFSTLNNLADQTPINRLDYWIGRDSQLTAVTHPLLYGKTLIGLTIEDLIRWEDWFAGAYQLTELDTAGISYGGDLVLIYPAFSSRIRRIFASGTPEGAVKLIVTPGRHHEMDVPRLLEFFK
jgi:cephalosporin-C deacetylase-like acetyl esterase